MEGTRSAIESTDMPNQSAVPQNITFRGFAPSSTPHQAHAAPWGPQDAAAGSAGLISTKPWAQLQHPAGKKQGSERQGSATSPGTNSLGHFNPHVTKAADPRVALYRQVENKAETRNPM